MSLRLSASPKELYGKFYSLQTPQDVADLLEVELQQLHYHLYIVPKPSRYTTFDIPKRSGGVRTISAPATALKIIQQKLNQVLLRIYIPKLCVHSFLLERNIVTNARVHTRRRHVLNVDLKDFFPSINFGRVRGLFMGTPYELNPKVATILAQICCFNNQLPQGAPTSPIVSNMICAKMDSQLMSLAKANRCDYTRYADDISFSTNLPKFPSALATINADTGQVEVGTELARIINENGFRINPDKVRLRGRKLRQQVAGLTVNKFPNVRRKFVRQIRAMLHAWEKYGLKAAQEEFLTRYDKKQRSSWKQAPSFKRVVKGKIEFLGMVRGKFDPIYLRFCDQLRALAPELVKKPVSVPGDKSKVKLAPYVTTEGKTDWRHLKAAITRLKELGQCQDLDVEFNECEQDMGSGDLFNLCRLQAKTKQNKLNIFIFDRDEPDITKKVVDSGKVYKDWGNNVFSFAIPVPKHRIDSSNISIEFYYTDAEIKREDKSGRRLFLSDEFDRASGRHRDPNLNLNCTARNKIRSPNISVIDCDVYNEQNENVALPKIEFANYILNREEKFEDFDFSEFQNIFSVIRMIAKKMKKK